jgi:hypothetical protein
MPSMNFTPVISFGNWLWPSDANAAFDTFVETYAIKYDKAVGCLRALEAPADHQPH